MPCVVRPMRRRFYRAAVACEFHTGTCEQEVRTALAAASGDQEYELREHLNSYYFRAGRYRLALAQVERMAMLRPDAADVRNALPMLRALAQRADPTVATRASSSVAVRVSNENFPVPMTINGRRADFFFDTGANLSAMTESEAKRLGLDRPRRLHAGVQYARHRGRRQSGDGR